MDYMIILQGWNDVSFHGSNEILTPNIDTLANMVLFLTTIMSCHYALPVEALS